MHICGFEQTAAHTALYVLHGCVHTMLHGMYTTNRDYNCIIQWGALRFVHMR